MTRVLSFAGRVELAKTILLGSMNYWIQTFKLPQAIIAELERIICNFIWKDGMHAISWDTICRPKKEGGLGLRKIKDMSKAAGIKLCWRLGTITTLWSSWMKYSYFASTAIWNYSPKLLDSGIVKFIIQSRELASQYITRSEENDHPDSYVWTGNATNTFSYASAWDISRVKHQKFLFQDVL